LNLLIIRGGVVLVVGGSILAAPFSLVSYFAALRFFTRLRERRDAARARRRRLARQNRSSA